MSGGASMIIVITRNGKRVGISTVIGTIDTRILTGKADAALREDLKQLSPEQPKEQNGMIQYKIEVRDEDGSSRNLFAAQDPNSQWATTLKRILNEAGLAYRI